MNLTRRTANLRRLLMTLAVLLPAASAFAQLWPRPSSSINTDVLCSASSVISPTCTSPLTQLTAGYPATLGFAGRFADAENTHVEAWPFRTAFARLFHVTPTAAPATANRRAYAMLGSALAAYSLDTFMTRLAVPEPLTPVGARVYPPEYSLTWDQMVYAESSDQWTTHVEDGLDRLFDFDWDDRGNVYLAYDIFGWGIVQDNRSGGQMPLLYQNSDQQTFGEPQRICTIKSSDGNYYVIVGGSTGWLNVWRTSNVTSPVMVWSRTTGTMNGYAKTADKIAIIEADNSIDIFKIDDFVRSASAVPIRKFSGPYGGLASDGTNFWAAGPTTVSKFAPSGTDMVETPYAAVGTSAGIPSVVSYSNGFLAVAGLERFPAGNAYNIRLYKVTSNGPVEISTNVTKGGSTLPFFGIYYGGGLSPSTGYVTPHFHTLDSVELFTWSGKTYLAISDHGLGDIWQIKAGDTLSISAPLSFGTTNPGVTGSSGTPPFYGDTLSFTSSLSSSLISSVNWSFGDNGTATANTGSTQVSHQWVGITNPASLPLVEQVSAVLASDTTISDTKSISLARPEARITTTSNRPKGIVYRSGAPKMALLSGDSFLDASDGTVEGHYSEWTLDTAASTKKAPTVSIPAGTCGNHTLSFTAHYGPYAAGPGSGSDMPLSINGLTYSVNPFVIGIVVPTAVSDPIVFSPSVALSSEVPTSTAATYTWKLIASDGTTVIDSATGSGVQIGQIPNYSVLASKVNAHPGSKVTLTVSVSIPTSPCANQSQQTASTPALNGVDPVVHVSGCANVGSPCTITATSIINPSMANWVYSWRLVPAGGTGVLPSSSPSYSPTLATANIGIVYTPTLTVQNGISSATVTGPTITPAAPLCSANPTDLNTGITITNASNAVCGSGSVPCPPGTQVSFKASPFGWTPQGCERYSWDFGDGSSAPASASNTTTHTYASSGSFPVTLTVQAATTGTIASTIVVGTIVAPNPQPGPQPGGSCNPMTSSSGYVSYYGPVSQCNSNLGNCNPGESITFNVVAQGYNFACSAVTWSWNFGDGGSANTKSANHTYAASGTYTAALTASNNGGTQTFSAQVRVGSGVGGSCSTQPSSLNTSITALDASNALCGTSGSPCATGQNVTLRAAAFGWTPQGCETYAWNFGDGTSDPASTNSQVIHVFANPGSKTVTLTVQGGSTATLSATVVVAGAVSGNCSTLPSDLNTSVTVTGPAGCLGSAAAPCGSGATVSFKTSPFGWTPQGCETYTWNFGDGSATATSTDAEPTHIYASAGTYTVTATVTGGSTATLTRAVVISGQTGGTPTPTAADFDYTLTAIGPDGVTVTFTPSVTPDGSGTKFKWDYGDTATATTTSLDPVTHKYATPGQFVVTLVINDLVTVTKTVTTGTVRPRSIRR